MDSNTLENTLEFVVPLPLEKCVRRLEARHEKMTWFSWDWQRRTWVRVRQQDPNTYRFTLKRIEKNSFIPYGSLAVVRGYLRQADRDHTVVLAEKQIVYVWMVLPLLYFMGVLAAMLLSGDQRMASADLRLWAVLMAVIGIGSAVFSWWWAGAQMRVLEGELKEALGGPLS